jgi:hypothetical protein
VELVRDGEAVSLGDVVGVALVEGVLEDDRSPTIGARPII